jgi:hypothetical protein
MIEVEVDAGIDDLNVLSERLRRSFDLLARTPITAAGTISRTTWSRFANSSEVSQATPVAVPPGRLRLATRPNFTGSSPARKTSGIVLLAARAPSAELMPVVTNTAEPRWTRSAARAGSRSR